MENRNQKAYRAVFFDFDYTLGDSTKAIVIGFQAGFRAMGLPEPTVEQVRPTIGMTLVNAYTHITGDPDQTKGQHFTDLFQSAVGAFADAEGQKVMIEGTELFPGTGELLLGLQSKGIQAAIVSTKPGVLLEKILAFRKLDHVVSLIVGGWDVKKAKPDPEGLLFALSHLGLAPGEVLFCGDTVIDAKTAANGGTDFCAVLNGTTPAEAFEEYAPVHIAPDLWDLKAWLGV